jgi:hypothetical protein
MREVQGTALGIRNLNFDLYVARKDGSPYVAEIVQALEDLEKEWPAVCPASNRECALHKEQKRKDDGGVRLPPVILCGATTEQWANAQNVCPYKRQ